jgi:hypothetical protein
MTTAVDPVRFHRTRTGRATLPPLSRNSVEAFPCRSPRYAPSGPQLRERQLTRRASQARPVSVVGLRRGAGITSGPFPQAAAPNPACQSPGTGLSACLAH